MSIEPRRRWTSAAVYGRVTPSQRLSVFQARSSALVNSCLSMAVLSVLGERSSVEILVRNRRQELRNLRAVRERGQNSPLNRKVIRGNAVSTYPFSYGLHQLRHVLVQ